MREAHIKAGTAAKCVYGAVLSGCFGSKFAEFNVIKFDDKVYCCIHK